MFVRHTHTVTGKTIVPEIFFNDRLIGGLEDLQRLKDKGQLEEMIKECLSSPTLSDFPPTLRRPASEEFLKVSNRSAGWWIVLFV